MPTHGDQMAIHVPLSEEAQMKLVSSCCWAHLNPKDENWLKLLRDILHYYLTMEEAGREGEGMVFAPWWSRDGLAYHVHFTLVIASTNLGQKIKTQDPHDHSR